MGDNACKSWEWHNTDVGSGYQAKGVYRQPSANVNPTKIVDMSRPVESNEQRKHSRDHENTKENSHKISKKKKSKPEKKSKKKKSKKESVDHSESENSEDDHIDQISSYNPLLQLFISKISEDTSTS